MARARRRERGPGAAPGSAACLLRLQPPPPPTRPAGLPAVRAASVGAPALLSAGGRREKEASSEIGRACPGDGEEKERLRRRREASPNLLVPGSQPPPAGGKNKQVGKGLLAGCVPATLSETRQTTAFGAPRIGEMPG